MQLELLAKQLAQVAKDVLFIDTCAMLDIVRSPIRETFPICREVVDENTRLLAGASTVELVFSSVFMTEWHEHLAIVQAEVDRKVENHYLFARQLAKYHRLLFGVSPRVHDVRRYGYATKLADICQSLIQHAHIVDSTDEHHANAMKRVLAARAPASKGKAEPKDCVVFEEAIALGTSLSKEGFSGKFVFVSSNTTDFGTISSPHKPIAEDLLPFSGVFTNTFDHARSILS